MVDNTDLPTLLRTWRERALLTQEELAERTGLGVRTIRRLETSGGHRPQSGSVRLLADALRLTETERAQLAAAARGDLAQPPSIPSPPAAPRSAPPPRQLPPDIAGFAGRDGHLSTMDELLTGKGPTATVVISAIAGTAGVGKTALALHWAHRNTDRFPDGTLYVNLRGFDPTGPPMTPGEAIRGFLDAFAVNPEQIPTSLDAQVALYRSLLAGRRILIVLDNASDTDQIRPLLPGAAGCMALITSRNQLTSLIAAQGAHALTVDLLSTDEAHTLLTNRLGADRVAREPGALDRIIDRCARLPLALAVAAARAAMYPTFPLDVLASELSAARHGLDALADGEPATNVRAVFSWSYRRLSDHAAWLFRILGNHPGPDISTAAAASTAGMTLRQARPLVAELTHAHLLTEHRPGHYTSHDLLRAYATELTHNIDSQHDRLAATRRLLDHYLHTAHAAAEQQLVFPHRPPLEPGPPAAGVTPEQFVDRQQARNWFTGEHSNLVAAVYTAADSGLDDLARQLAWALSGFLDRFGHWRDQDAVQTVALEAARRQQDRPAQAHTHRLLARTYARLRRYDEADAHYRHALELFENLADLQGQAAVHSSVASLRMRQGEVTDALRYAQRALDLYTECADETGQARALNSLGWCHALLGQHEQTITYCWRALTLYRHIGNLDGAGAAWDTLGYAQHKLGRYQEATSCYQRAISLAHAAGALYDEAEFLDRLGDNHQALSEYEAARDAWRRSLAILENLGHPTATQVRQKFGALPNP